MVGSGVDVRYDVLYDDGGRVDGLREEFVNREGADEGGNVGGGGVGAGSSSGVGGRGGASSSSSSLREGDRVTAKYRGKGKWFAGKITRVVGSGVDVRYDVLYDDGDRDDGLREEFVKREGADEGGIGGGVGVGASSSGVGVRVGASSISSSLREGDRVTAKYRGKGKWFAGKITRVVGSGVDVRYDVLYDDGDRDDGLREEFVKREGADEGGTVGGGGVGASSSGADVRGGASSISISLREGDRVTAKYRGKGKWFAGKITRVVGSGADVRYDVLYDDGDRDDGLREEFVKREGADEGGIGGGVGVGASSSGSSLREGDRVTAKYRGKGKWFAGKVTRVVGSGVDVRYDVLYDDGDRDDGLREEFVKREGADEGGSVGGGGGVGVGASSSGADVRVGASSISSSLREGDRVTAKYRGKGKWFAGKITRVVGSGVDVRYDVLYDDGDRDDGLREEFVKREGADEGGSGGGGGGVGASSSGVGGRGGASSSSSSLREGDRVTAKYRGKGSGSLVRSRVWLAAVRMFGTMCCTMMGIVTTGCEKSL